MKLAKFSAKLVANFRRSLEGDFRASFAGENRQKHFPPKLHRKFHHQYEVWVVAGPRNSSATELESGNAPGTFPLGPAGLLDEIVGSMHA